MYTKSFRRQTFNNETVNRSWLCYSPTTGKIYCYICKLVAVQNSQISSNGFCDWKHANERLTEHEKSKSHLDSVRIFAKVERNLGVLTRIWKMSKLRWVDIGARYSCVL